MTLVDRSKNEALQKYLEARSKKIEDSSNSSLVTKEEESAI